MLSCGRKFYLAKPSVCRDALLRPFFTLRRTGTYSYTKNLHLSTFLPQIAITSWTPRGKNLGHGWSRRIYP